MNRIGLIRKGFYCSLCSVKNQKYFDEREKKVTFAEEFCENLVENSIETIYYKTFQILPTFYNFHIILDCKDGSEIDEN